MKRDTVPVSVIIPCYCCSDTIERAVRSIVDQTAMPSELLLVEDDSPDQGKTLAMLHALQQQYADVLPIEIIALEKNAGPSAARNTAWDRASQPYVAFLDADDSWYARKLEIQFDWMKERPEVAICGHLCDWKEASCDHEFDENSGVPYTVISRASLLLRNAFSTPTVMLKRSLPFRFEPEKRHAEDYYLWLQIVLAGHRMARLELPLAALHKAPYGEAGLSADLWTMEKGVQDVFRRLYGSGELGVLAAWGCRLFSLLKYVRRTVLARRMLPRGE